MTVNMSAQAAAWINPFNIVDNFADASIIYDLTNTGIVSEQYATVDVTDYTVEVTDPYPLYSQFPSDGSWSSYVSAWQVTGWLKFTITQDQIFDINTFSHDLEEGGHWYYITYIGIYTGASGPGAWEVFSPDGGVTLYANAQADGHYTPAYAGNVYAQSEISGILPAGTYYLQISSPYAGDFYPDPRIIMFVNYTFAPAPSFGFAQAEVVIIPPPQGYAQAQALMVSYTYFSYAESAAWVIYKGNKSANTQARVGYRWHIYAQAQARIRAYGVPRYAQAQARIRAFGQVQTAQVQVVLISIHTRISKVAQTQAQVFQGAKWGQAQVQVFINSPYHSIFAQALAQIYSHRRQAFSQTQTNIIYANTSVYATTQADIKQSSSQFSQAEVYIRPKTKSAQAQTTIHRINYAYGAAQALVGHFKVGQAQAYIANSAYLIKYNNHVLPGYAQSEAFTSDNLVQDHYVPYDDGSLSEYTGLQNKIISLQMRVWDEAGYLSAKNQVQTAGTILRSARGWTKAYIQRSDRYYTVLARSIKMDQNATSSPRVIDYSIELSAKPWLTSDTVNTYNGTSLITITRTLANGGWTPATINITGTNVTVSGYTATEFTGFISISGVVAGMLITSEPFGASIAGADAQRLIKNPDYSLYIGPGTTYISLTGTASCTITYSDRWYL